LIIWLFVDLFFEGEIMGYIYSFENLDVWKIAKDLVIKLYRITNNFPDCEKFGIILQIRRAAVSLASNLAEGNSRTTNKDQAHFTQMAYGSMMEIVCQLIISKELGYLSQNDYDLIRDKAEEITNKLNALKNIN
jgi:four helix bundle protein